MLSSSGDFTFGKEYVKLQVAKSFVQGRAGVRACEPCNEKLWKTDV